MRILIGLPEYRKILQAKVDAGKFDYTLTDKVLDAVFKEDPDIYYIPRIKLNMPIAWCKENSEKVFVCYDGNDFYSAVPLLESEHLN